MNVARAGNAELALHTPWPAKVSADRYSTL